MRALAAARLSILAFGCAALVAGCGADEAATSSALVNPDSKAPAVNSIDVESPGDAILLTTNRGFFRIEDGAATRIDARARTPDGATPVGNFLAITSLGEGHLLGSGHPDRRKGNIAPFLGLLRSDDAGQSWRSVSRYGIADLHVIRSLHGLLYAYDAFIPAFLVSPDDGKSWSERATPPGLVLDFVVDPEDPDHLIASNASGIFASTDQAASWRSTAGAESARLEWPEADALYRADGDGLVYVSENGGNGWNLVGRIDGKPLELHAAGPEELYAALSDATILRSNDAGRSWEEVFTP